MEVNSEFLKTFMELKKLPKGHIINDPDKLIPLGLFLREDIAILIKATGQEVFFTRKSLKHLSEKGGDPQALVQTITGVLQKPDHIYKNKGFRFILSKVFHRNEKPYPHVVSLEVADKNIVITLFIANADYLKNFEILWRTETLSNGPSISTLPEFPL